MLKLNKIKKRTFIFFVFLFVILLYGIFRSRNYEIEYTVRDVTVVEKFKKEDKTYEFLFKTKEKEFFVAIEHQYIHSKKVISNIEIKEKEGLLCLILSSDKLDVYPLCMQNDAYISYQLIEDTDVIDLSLKKEISYEEKTFQNINMYYLNNQKYFIWNYEGFLILSDKEQKEVKLFKEDVYNIPLTIKVGPYLLMADYDAKYAFRKFYVVNSKNEKIQELSLEKEVSFDSYFLGTTNKKAYLVDRKNKNEYEIYPKRRLMESIVNNNQGRILNNDVWESISLNNLVNKENHFVEEKVTQFLLDGNVLYKVQGSQKTKLSFQNVKEIVYSTEDTVYYLVGDKLYYYNDFDGEVLVLSHFEWNFNYKNMIYVF